jgi:hypothetical protein
MRGSSPIAQLQSAFDGTWKIDMNKVDFSKKPDVKDTLEETDKRDYKVIGIFKMTVAVAAKTAKASNDDKLQNRTIDFPNVTKQ